MYAEVRNGTIVRTGGPRQVEFKLLDGAALSPPETGWTNALLALCAVFPVAEPTPPVLTAQQTFDADTFAIVAGQPTRVYNVRNKTQAELDAAAADAAAQAERDQAKAAVAAINTFLAIPPASLTNVQIRDEVILLSRVCKRLILDTFR